jgi:hypothetical protein
MPLRRSGVTIELDKHKLGGVIFLLDNTEAGTAWFLDAVAGIIDGGGFEGFHLFGLDRNKDMDDEHKVHLVDSRLKNVGAALILL